ncbi:MAG: 1,4-dihydroxy-6-naphthoate synthase [Desulfatitalea sp.]|nr:1,4-dihydroxy-6-naphthoate synthase [Desulfatitalea sp.]
MHLSLGFSPCPNDTFIFDGLVKGSVPLVGHTFEVALHDVETLNRMAFGDQLDVTKLSFFAWLAVRERYRLLSCGGALGYGCGPVVIARRPLAREDMAGCRVVLPGEWTTAHLLFRLWAPEAAQRHFVPYDRVFDTLHARQADCGVIIHESRFTYAAAGFHAVVDLGAWWEERTGLPIPLGGIAAHQRVPETVVAQLEAAIRRSIATARANPDGAMPYIRTHAQEMTADVLRAHIDTFVNDFSLDSGPTGRQAVRRLAEEARLAGILP